MNARLGRSLLSCSVVAMLVAVAPAASAQGSSELRAPVEGDRVMVQSFAPTVFNAEDPRLAANQLFGETITITEAQVGGRTERSGFATVPHFVVLGSLLIVRDTPDATPVILKTLRDLEAAEAKRQKEVQDTMDAAERRNQDEPAAAIASLELRPRHVSFQTLFTALQPFQRDAGSLIGVERSNLIVVRDTPKRLAELKEFVARIDRPRPQVAIHVMLVQTLRNTDTNDSKLPPDLVHSLQAMLPGQYFDEVAVGMLRCSMQSDQECTLDMNFAQGGSWNLSFVPEAYDPDSGQISLTRCRFHLEGPRRGGQDPRVQQFETNLTVTAGEHVALGAVGEEPIFVVLRAEPLKQAQ